jgi:integrase/recombinase XerD
MHLQRIVLPCGKVTWTAYEGDALVPEVCNFVIYLELRHYAPHTVSHYARHVTHFGSYLAALGKSFRKITDTDLDCFIQYVAKSGRTREARPANIIPLRTGRVEISAKLPSFWTFSRRLSS